MELDTDFVNKVTKVWRVPEYILEYAIDTYDEVNERNDFIINVSYIRYICVIWDKELTEEDAAKTALEKKTFEIQFPIFVKLTIALAS
jgi:hypothetical protein